MAAVNREQTGAMQEAHRSITPVRHVLQTGPYLGFSPTVWPMLVAEQGPGAYDSDGSFGRVCVSTKRSNTQQRFPQAPRFGSTVRLQASLALVSTAPGAAQCSLNAHCSNRWHRGLSRWLEQTLKRPISSTQTRQARLESKILVPSGLLRRSRSAAAETRTCTSLRWGARDVGTRFRLSPVRDRAAWH